MAAETGKSAKSKTTGKSTTTRRKTTTARKKTPARKRTAATKRAPARKNKVKEIESIAQSSVDVIRKAASILNEEVSAGIAAARQVENSITGKQDFSEKDFSKLVSRFRKDAHDIVNLIGDQINDGGKSTPPAKRKANAETSDDSGFQSSAHEVVDLVMNLVDNAPTIIEKISKLDIFSTTDSSDKKPAKRPTGKATK